MLNYYENSGIYYFRPICIKILLIHEFGNEKKIKLHSACNDQTFKQFLVLE